MGVFWGVTAAMNLGIVALRGAVSRASLGFPDLISLDVLVLTALLALATPLVQGATPRRWLVRGVSGTYFFLLAFEAYDAVVRASLHRAGILYDDAQHVVGAVHLTLNLLTPLRALAFLAVLVAAGLLVWAVPRGIRHAMQAARHPVARWSAVAAGTIALLTVAIDLHDDRGRYIPAYGASVSTTAEKVVANVQASLDLRREVEAFTARSADSTYLGYDDLQLSDRPNVYVLMIESYGTVLQSHADLSAPYDRLLGRMETRLEQDGWHAVSSASRAPVRGGTSWLSVASLMLGTTVHAQALYSHLRPHISRAPHLIRFLDRNGYLTVALQPPTRARAGLTVSNPYGFDRTLFFDDLQYRGPRYGWGIVPDQYSLGFAHDRVLSESDAPVAVFFEATASHVPWDDPPPLLARWQDFHEDPARLARASSMQPASAPPEAPPGAGAAERFFRTIAYDWTVLARFLEERVPAGSLVLILGDHQPPLLQTGDRRVPVHVLSREPERLQPFAAQGFRPGLRPVSDDASRLRHAGLYSLLVHALAASSEQTPSVTPSVRPDGVSRPAFLPR